MRNARIYIAGPMRGRYLYNFPAFDAARDRLTALGFDVVSPADMDRERGFDPKKLDWDVFDLRWSSWPEDAADFKQVVKEDLDALQTCSAIYVLEGWGESTGAKAELTVAKWLGLLEIYE